ATISSPMPNSTTIHGLAPVDITASNLSMLTVDGGTGANNFVVQSPAAPTLLNTGTGADQTFVQSTTFALTVNGQGATGVMDMVTISSNATPAAPTSPGNVQAITGTVTISNANGSSTALVVDDSTDTVAKTGVTITSTQITGLAPATINYDNNLKSLTV